MSGKVTYNACFHDLERGLQTHCYAPMGLNIKGKWTLGGSLPGEPIAPVELGLGAPLQGLYLREDVDMKCNIMMTKFVKKTLKKAHSALVARLLVKAQIVDTSFSNPRINTKALTPVPGVFSGSQDSSQYTPSDYGESPTVEAPQIPPIHGPSPQAAKFRDRMTQNGPSLFPQALNIRNSISSQGEPIESQTRRTSYQESLPGNHNPRASDQKSLSSVYNQKASWQNIDADNSRPLQPQQQVWNRSRSPSRQQVDPEHQNADPYRTSSQSNCAEFPSNDAAVHRPGPRFAPTPPGYQSPPPLYGHAELE